MKWARDVVSAASAEKVPGKVRAVARRMMKLSPIVVLDLEAEEAPLHVFRWVSWAKGASAQRRRTDLAVYLRRTIERRRNGWLEERHLTAALTVWDAATAEARVRGVIAPRPQAVSITRYEEAIDGARKSSRARFQPSDAAVAGDVAKEETVDEVPGGGTAAAEQEPSHARALGGLAATLAAAIEEGDMKAARVTHEAIGKLVPSKLPGSGPAG
jgi:hypothetical protein